MREAALEPLFTFDEFLAFYESRPDEERWELFDGIPEMMNPPVLPHQAVVRNLIFLLHSASLARDADWQVFPGAGVHVPYVPRSAPVPDLLVRRGPVPRGGYCDDPVILFEVLSPSTARRDRKWKRTY